MPAANTDKARKGAPNFATTLAAPIISGTDTSMSLSLTTGLPTDTAITLTIDPTLSSKETVTGVVSGTSIISLSRGLDGTTAQAHSNGANVVQWFTANDWNDFISSYLNDHVQAGYHSNLHDINGASWLGQTAVTNAVNYVNISNNATGSAPSISATGTDTNIALNLKSKGSSYVQHNGVNFMDVWISWSPTISNITVGNGTTVAVYSQIGKMVFFKFIFTMGSTSAMGNNPTITTPTTMNTRGLDAVALGIGTAEALGLENSRVWAFQLSTLSTWVSNYGVQIFSTTTVGQIYSSTNPFTWAAGDKLIFEGYYEST